jgi:hypothetical protein
VPQNLISPLAVGLPLAPRGEGAWAGASTWESRIRWALLEQQAAGIEAEGLARVDTPRTGSGTMHSSGAHCPRLRPDARPLPQACLEETQRARALGAASLLQAEGGPLRPCRAQALATVLWRGGRICRLALGVEVGKMCLSGCCIPEPGACSARPTAGLLPCSSAAPGSGLFCCTKLYIA